MQVTTNTRDRVDPFIFGADCQCGSSELVRTSVHSATQTRAGAQHNIYLVEVVVAQTVGKIQVGRISRNRIPTGRRIKPYIHGVAKGAAQLWLNCAQFVSAV